MGLRRIADRSRLRIDRRRRRRRRWRRRRRRVGAHFVVPGTAVRGTRVLLLLCAVVTVHGITVPDDHHTTVVLDDDALRAIPDLVCLTVLLDLLPLLVHDTLLHRVRPVAVLRAARLGSRLRLHVSEREGCRGLDAPRLGLRSLDRPPRREAGLGDRHLRTALHAAERLLLTRLDLDGLRGLARDRHLESEGTRVRAPFDSLLQRDGGTLLLLLRVLLDPDVHPDTFIVRISVPARSREETLDPHANAFAPGLARLDACVLAVLGR